MPDPVNGWIRTRCNVFTSLLFVGWYLVAVFTVCLIRPHKNTHKRGLPEHILEGGINKGVFEATGNIVWGINDHLPLTAILEV